MHRCSWFCGVAAYFIRTVLVCVCACVCVRVCVCGALFGMGMIMVMVIEPKHVGVLLM